jgi:hypothetical protein
VSTETQRELTTCPIEGCGTSLGFSERRPIFFRNSTFLVITPPAAHAYRPNTSRLAIKDDGDWDQDGDADDVEFFCAAGHTGEEMLDALRTQGLPR